MSNALVVEKERPTTVTILVDRELRDRLERAAAASERSLGAEVRVALKRHLERDDNGDEGGGKW
jgi:predicted transcriptional regulator